MSETAREWRERNPDYIAAYNAGRRIGPVKLLCTECGGEFEGRKGRLVCSRRCKDARYTRRHPEKAKAKAARHQRRVRARLKQTKRERQLEGKSTK
jgi:hypothetical protein